MPKASVLFTSTLVVGLAAGVGLRVAAQAEEPVTIRFAAQVGDQPFDCGETYELGSLAAPMKVSDFRFYVSDIHLLDRTGKAVPVTLLQDGQWQHQNVALLDFEDRSGACVNGTPETRDQVVGTAPRGDYVGLRFNLGIPFELNHEDAALAPSPLNLTSLWWNWQGGYKFVRIDLEPAQPQAAGERSTLVANAQPLAQGHHGGGHGHGHGSSRGFSIHLGSTGCPAAGPDQRPTQPCAYPNLVEVEFPNFDPAKDVVVADLAALVEGTDVTINQVDTPPGCMSGRNDRDCDLILKHFGTTGEQRFFRLQ
ncbi:MAG: metallo-mystery pair system four-Cys motif protein [Thermostichus sp. DG02_5_bins_236]